MTLRITAKGENIKSIVCLRHGQMYINVFLLKLLLELDFVVRQMAAKTQNRRV
jgi:hypothetical protein